MEDFILRLIGIICTTIITCSIIISRKDDIDISAIIIASILELLSMFIIFFPKEVLLQLVDKII